MKHADAPSNADRRGLVKHLPRRAVEDGGERLDDRVYDQRPLECGLQLVHRFPRRIERVGKQKGVHGLAETAVPGQVGIVVGLRNVRQTEDALLGTWVRRIIPVCSR